MTVFKPPTPYIWTTDWKTAEFEQVVLSHHVELIPFDPDRAGDGLAVGVAYSERSHSAYAIGLRATWNGERVGDDVYGASADMDFPYIPGLFAYREAAAITAMLETLDFEPDILLFDTQGIAHPRRLGLASHIGVITGRATVGVTRRRLRGRPQTSLPREGVVALFDRGQRVGAALCRSGTEPLYASPGHRTNVEFVLRWLDAFPKRGRGLPPALAEAHRLANQEARRR
jgi:deoxyribonuclease V